MSAPIAVPAHSGIASRHARLVWWAAYSMMVGGGLLIAVYARRRIDAPFLGLSLAIFVVLLLSWLISPRNTFYATIFLATISDVQTLAWFPFAKNFSSRESIAFIADALTISPLDISLVVGFSVAALRQYASSGRLIAPSALTRPVLVFTAFVVFGFARGIVLGGGDVKAAVFEGRPLFYLVLVLGIAVNICTEASHLRHALWWVLGGVTIQSLLSIDYLSRLDPLARDALESLNEHGSTLGHNLLIVTAFGLVFLRTKATIARLALLLALIPTIYVYMVAQRRAGVASLALAFLLMMIVLFWRSRRTFFVVFPLITIVALGYLGSFWNSQTTIGFPAQAIKSVVAPGDASQEDRDSDLYRQVEAFDVNFTIRTDPLKGIGFGRPFYRPIPLPEITFFGLNAYVPHNSILWIWLKTGFVGFAAMFYMFAKAIMLGARRVRVIPDGIDLVVAQSGLLFVVMYALYTYVDISWDARNMVLLGLAFAICAHPLPTDRTSEAATSEPPTARGTDVWAASTSP